MTEKRFYLDVSEAYSGILKIIDFGDGSESIYSTSSRPDMETVVEILNKLNNENEQLKEKNKKNIQFVFKIIETYSADCFDHNEGGWSYMLNDLIETLKNGMELEND